MSSPEHLVQAASLTHFLGSQEAVALEVEPGAQEAVAPVAYGGGEKGADVAVAADPGPGGGEGRKPHPACLPWLGQVLPLMWREFLITTRNPADVAGRLLTYTW